MKEKKVREEVQERREGNMADLQVRKKERKREEKSQMTLRKICELPKKCYNFVKVDDPNKKKKKYTNTHPNDSI